MSIAKFINTIKRPPKALPKTDAEQERDSATADIRKEFAEYLRTLDAYEVGILCATLDDVLAVANADLKERVCGHYEGPYYKNRDEYCREQEAERSTPKAPQKDKKKSRRDPLRECERLAAADNKEAKEAKWNQLPVRGNTEPPTKHQTTTEAATQYEAVNTTGHAHYQLRSVHRTVLRG